MSLRIQCPACQRQFKVGEDLRGRTVECGACEHRFLVSEESIVSTRDRYFPGDIKKPGLEHCARTPVSDQRVEPVQFATASYDQSARAADVTPAPPQRVIAGALGVVVLVLFAVILLFATQSRGVVGEMADQKRILLSAFVSVVGASLIIYGAHRRKVGAFLGAGALVAGVMGLAVFLGGAAEPTAVAPESPPPSEDDPVAEPPADELTEAEVKRMVTYEPVENAIKNFGFDSVVALWVPVLKPSFKYQIQRYLHRKTGTGQRPSIFNRSPGGLVVIEGTDLTLPEVERVVERFATVDEVYPNIRVLKITIQGERLVPPSTELEEKLEDKEHGAFYRLNEEELHHIDLDRIREAANRLSEAEPKSRRPQITARLVELLDEDPDPEFRSTICDAIAVWSEPGDGAEKEVARVARDMVIDGEAIPRSMIRFLISRKSPETLPILEMLWKEDQTTWEPLLIDFGAEAETLVVPYLESEDRGLVRSAVTILKRIGSQASLPALREAFERAGSDEEMKLVIQSAIDSLESE